jgi:dienelactone hydrolase
MPRLCGFLLIAAGCVGFAAFKSIAASPASGVHPLFDLSSPERSPFPSDRFTVADDEQNTARRVNLPMPDDCTAEASECGDVAILNQLDGFNLNARIAVPFDGDIDPSSITSQTVFLVSLGDALARHEAVLAEEDENFDPGDVQLAGTTVGINHIVWTPETRELSFRPDQTLDQHTTYVLAVTTGVRDGNGTPIGVAEGFSNFRRDLAHDHDRYYRRALLTATWAVGRVFGGGVEVAALSVFTTQTATHIVERMHEAIYAAPAPTLDFNVGLAGERAVFADAEISTLTQNAEINVGGPLTPQTINLAQYRAQVPGAVGTVAFGTYRTLDFTTRPSSHIAPIPTRTGTLAATGEVVVAFDLWLPAGARPAGGWPVQIYGHGVNGSKDSGARMAAIAASRGLATITINGMSRGLGPRTTMTLRRTNNTTVTFAAPGLGYDQNGDGMIGVHEPRRAAAPYHLFNSTATVAQTTAQHFALVRALQAGVDGDGDGAPDLDGARIYYVGQSLGGPVGMLAFAFEPALRAAAFASGSATLPYQPLLSPSDRPALGNDLLASRVPSLINSAYGITSIDGRPTSAPFFNENLPLRDQPPLVNTVPGSVAIQRVADHIAWASQIANATAFAPLLRRAPVAGVPARPFIVQYARGDQTVPNPAAMDLIRAGDFADRVSFYRHDLNFGLAGVPADPHAYYNTINAAAPNFYRIYTGAQDQVTTFFQSDGVTFANPTPTELWETQIAYLRDDLYYLPRP